MNTATVAPVAPTYAPVAAPAFTPAFTRGEQAYGKVAAAEYPVFRAYYGIVKSDRGTLITGPSPDGRYTGTCDRCGIAISHVYVFTNRAGSAHMHVGVDCAQRMGVPVDELRKARAFATEVGRLRDRAARRANRDAAAMAAREQEEAERAYNRAVHGAILADLEGLAADENLTDWERRRLEMAVGMVERVGDFLTPVVVADEDDQHRPVDTRSEYEQDVALDVETIRDRLSLCRTSRACEAAEILAAVQAVSGWSTEGKAAVRAVREQLAAGVKGKAGKGLSKAEKDAARGVVTLTLEVWRNAMELPGGDFGPRYRNFLRDDAGTAYTYVGGKASRRGDRVTATWTITGTDTYAGLTATRLSRPRNATIQKLHRVGEMAMPPTDSEEVGGEYIVRDTGRAYYPSTPTLGAAEGW